MKKSQTVIVIAALLAVITLAFSLKYFVKIFEKSPSHSISDNNYEISSQSDYDLTSEEESQEVDDEEALVRKYVYEVKSTVYGTAGSSLNQAKSAASILLLAENIEEYEAILATVLEEMSTEELDRFSFQWEMMALYAGKIAEDPERHYGIIMSAGMEDFKVTKAMQENLDYKKNYVENLFKEYGVKYIWKEFTYDNI